MSKLRFSVTCNNSTNYESWEAFVDAEKGEVTQILFQYWGCNGGGYSDGGESVYFPKNDDFEQSLCTFIKHMHQRSQKYEEFVNVLNQTVLEKYFKLTYVPK